MKPTRLIFAGLAAAYSFAAPAVSQVGFPFADESLRYSLNMPGGPKLGEGKLTARKAQGGSGWNFELSLDAP